MGYRYPVIVMHVSSWVEQKLLQETHRLPTSLMALIAIWERPILGSAREDSVQKRIQYHSVGTTNILMFILPHWAFLTLEIHIIAIFNKVKYFVNIISFIQQTRIEIMEYLLWPLSVFVNNIVLMQVPRVYVSKVIYLLWSNCHHLHL